MAGRGAKTFNNEFRDIDSQITALFRHMQNLESQLKRLSSEVRRADEAQTSSREKKIRGFKIKVNKKVVL